MSSKEVNPIDNFFDNNMFDAIFNSPYYKLNDDEKNFFDKCIVLFDKYIEEQKHQDAVDRIKKIKKRKNDDGYHKEASKQEIIFILNLRDEHASSSKSKADLQQEMDKSGVKSSEYKKLQEFNDVLNNKEFMKKLKDEGRFLRTYPTEEEYVKKIFKKIPNRQLYYNVQGISLNPIEATAKLYYFCHLKNVEIPKYNIVLDDEQEEVLKHNKGFVVVNSGPGTGKTTTAVHKTKMFIDKKEPVIVVSYTNAAVNNFRDRLVNFIDDIDKVGSKAPCEVYLTTIDAISRLPFPRDHKSSSFSEQIELARQRKEKFKELFANNKGEQIYKHIIIDEAQDIDDGRFSLLFDIYHTCELESITIIGDPRQRMNSTKVGATFERLVTNGVVDKTVCKFTQDSPLLINFKNTYRFKNPLLLDLCNIISEKRPLIHAKLVNAIEQDAEEKCEKISDIDVASEKILDLLKNGTPPGEIAIISPITDKAGEIKKTFDGLKDRLAAKEKAVAEKIDPSIIYASSIQSVKGLEFDYVFFIGCSDYPRYMSGTYSNKNDGDSMNFVANSRARRKIFYLTDDSFLLPEHVPENFVIGEKGIEKKKAKYNFPYTAATDLFETNNIEKMESNMRTLFGIPRTFVDNVKYFGNQEKFNLKYEIISSLLMRLKGLTTLQQIGKIKPIEEIEFNIRSRQGLIYDFKPSLEVNTQNVIYTENMRENIRTIYRSYPYEDVEKHKLFANLMTKKTSVLKNMDEITDICVKLENLLLLHKDDSFFYQNIISCYTPASCILNKNVILIFTDSTYIGLLTKKRNPDKIVYITSLKTGKTYKIGEPKYSLKRYEYQIEFMYSLYTHDKFMKTMGNYPNFDPEKPELYIDTEFGPRVYNKSNTVYEISVINAHDPYLSISTYLLSDPFYFKPTCGDTSLKFSDFINCPNFIEFKDLFDSLYINKKPVINYYFSSVDLAIFYETDETFISEINKRRKILLDEEKFSMDGRVKLIIEDIFGNDKDFHEIFIGDYTSIENRLQQLSPREKKDFWSFFIDLEKGSKDLKNDKIWSFDNSKETNYVYKNLFKKGTLKEAYVTETGNYVSEMYHIKLHRAYSDALITMEMGCKRLFHK